MQRDSRGGKGDFGGEFTRTLDRSQDTLLRNSGWEVKNGTTTENSVRYDYSLTDGRLSSISNPHLSNVSFDYEYETGSSLVKTVTGPAHTVTNTWETNRNILDTKENKAGTTLVSKYDYLVNAIGQRSNVAQSGTAFAGSRDIAWGYDPLGQVTSADSTIPGLDRAYQFDLIGNRLRAATGSIDPNDPAATTYIPNALNQYSSINNQSSIINPQSDDDGNLTSGPLPANVNANSSLIWDGENRLIQAQVTGGATVNFIYDSQSRRIAETVGTVTKITVYDGWNPIAEYSISNNQYSISKTYLWGMDLSGTMQGAGGVGGLLAVTDSTGTYYPTYDGNGNVSEYLDSTGAVVAHYEYDPFGKTTVATGPKANDFAHRFSTKPLDITTGLYYYGYRFYDPETGRWPSRDPIEEAGGINIYGFVYNNGINYVDADGRLIPIAIIIGKVALSVAFDYSIDVAFNVMNDGFSWNAFVDVEIKSLAISAVIGLVIPAPGFRQVLGRFGDAFKAQEKFIILAERLGRRKNLLNKQALIQKTRKADTQEKAAWAAMRKDTFNIGAAILAENLANRVAEEVADEIKTQIGDDACPPPQSDSFKVDATFRWNSETGDVEVTPGGSFIPEK